MARSDHNRYNDNPPISLLLLALALTLAITYSAQPVLSAFDQHLERSHVNAVLDRLRLATAAHSANCLSADRLPQPCNPFALLNPPPRNYIGPRPHTDLSALPEGCWCFVPEFNWIAYHPVHNIYSGATYGANQLVIYLVAPVQDQHSSADVRLVQPPRFAYAWK
jgi:hypothetical protein